MFELHTLLSAVSPPPPPHPAPLGPYRNVDMADKGDGELGEVGKDSLSCSL